MRANDDAIGYKNLSMRLSRFCIRLTLAAVSLTLGHACVETGEGVGSDESAGQPSEGGDGQVAGSSGATIRGGTKNYDAGSGGVGDSSGTADIAGQGLGGQLQLGGGGQPDVAGNGGAGAESAGGAPGTTWPGCSTAIYCDDFESYDVLGQPWTVSTLNGVVGIDTARHASGSKSVKFSTSVGEDDARQAAISYTAAFPLERNELYGRVRVFSASVTDEIATKWYLVKAGGAGGTTRLGGQAETLESSFHGNTTECWSQSQTPMPLNEWACLEWHFDGDSNSTEVWLNGNQVEDITAVGTSRVCAGANKTWTLPVFAWTSIGYESFGKDEAREVWMDDLALDTVRIGCGQ